MTSAFSIFSNWRHARKTASESIERAAATVEDAAIQEARVIDLIRKHGPVVHNGHVYWFRHNQIVCEPCIDSILLNVEGTK